MNLEPWKKAKIIIVLIFVSLILAGEVNASTLVVNKTSPACTTGNSYYSIIQSAVDAANNGDTINVCPGTYIENVDVNKSVGLVGAGADVTIVSAASSSDSVFVITANSVNISDFAVKGAWSGWSAGVSLSNSNYSKIEKINASHNFRGIFLRSSSSNNTVANNTALNNDYGIYLSSSYDNVLTSNTALNNDYGILLDGLSSDNTITGNNVLNNTYGIYLYYSSSNNIANNHFNNTNNFGFGGTVYANYWNTSKTAGTNIIGGSWIGGNFWANPSGTGFSETCTDTDSDGICNSSYTLASGNVDYLPLAKVVGPKTIAVCSSGCDYTTIQEAVNAASDSDTIQVHAGIYTENVDVTKSVNLIGAGADVTIVSAASSSDHVFYVTANSVNISGLTVTGATTPYAGFYFFNSNYSKIENVDALNNNRGIEFWSSSNNTIINNNISNNNHGIHIEKTSNNIISNNTVSSNSWNGIYVHFSNHTIITDNSANMNNDSGISIDASRNTTLVNNTATLNNKSGICLTYTIVNSITFSSKNNTVKNNTLNSNKQNGICTNYATNNVIIDNVAKSNDKDGIFLFNSSDNAISENTFLNNGYYDVRAYNSDYNSITDNIACTIYNNTNTNTIANNVCLEENQPPVIGQLKHTPEKPTYMDDVTISATVSDDAGLSSVKLYYSIDNGAFNSVDMTNVGSTHSATIPKQSIGANVTYYVEAVDINGSSTQSGKYGYYSVQKVVQVAVILTKFSDNIPAPTKDANYFRQDIILNVIEYYYENSYGSIDFNFTIYDNSSNYYSLPQNHDYYGENFQERKIISISTPAGDKRIKATENATYFLWDAIQLADKAIDYDKYDTVIVVHPGYAEQEGDINDMGNMYIGWDATTYDTYDNNKDVSKNWIVIAEIRDSGSSYGGLAHELGHALGRILKSTPLPDRYEEAGSGDVANWDLMGGGSWLNPPVHMSSYSKFFLGWLNSEAKSYGMYNITCLPKMEYGDRFIIYNYGPLFTIPDYYILEARTRNNSCSIFDVNAPQAYPSGIAIYRVETRFLQSDTVDFVPNQVIQSTSIPTLNTMLSGSTQSYIDELNQINFTLVNEYNHPSSCYIAQVKIEHFQPTNRRGAIMSYTNSTVQLISESNPNITSSIDLDLHVYTPDGKHVGMNYTNGTYEIEIDGATASGDMFGEEWIFVPSDTSVQFKISSYDIEKYVQDHPEFNLTTENLTYRATTVFYDENSTKLESKSIITSISANKTSNITLPTKMYRSLEADDIIRNKTTLLNKELKVPVVVTAVYGDRYYVTNGKTGFMVFVNETSSVSIGDYGNVYGNISLEFNDTAIIPSDFEELGNLTIDYFKKSISTGNVISEYLENGSVLVNTTGTISSIGSDYIVFNDGSGDAKIYFKYGSSIPSTKAGDKINITGVLVNDSIGIIPINQNSFSITSGGSQNGGTSSGGGGGGGAAPKCIKEGFQSLDIDLMKCLLRESRLQYKQFYTDATSVGGKIHQLKIVKLLASILAITGEKTGEYPFPSLDVESYLSKSVKPLEGDIFELAKERILERWTIANTVVIARGDLEVDSLAAVAYAKANGIPILLTKTDEIPFQTTDVLEKLNTKKIIIVGGPVAVSEKIEKELENYGEVERIWGNDRVETAIEIAKSMEERHEIETIIVADGLDTSPEIAIIANNYKAPVVYVLGNEIPEVTKEFLKDHKKTKRYKKVMKIVFVGVSEEIQKEIEESME